MYELLFPNISESTASILTLVAEVLELIFLIIFVIAEWQLFKKFNEKPWKSLIPFYNLYLLYKYTWHTSAYWVYLTASLGFSVLFNASDVITKRNPDSLVASILLLICIPFGIVEIVHDILAAIRISEAFGKKKGFAVGLVFLYELFIMILGFGKSQYVLGKSEEEQGAAEDLLCDPITCPCMQTETPTKESE